MASTRSVGWLARRVHALNTRPFGRPEAAFYEIVASGAVRDIVRPLLLGELAPADPSVVLDVGCGGGALTRDLAAPRRLVVGTDPSVPQVRRCARRRVQGVTCAAAPAEHLPFADATFDALVSSCTVKHWPDLGRGLAECARVLRPGGRLVLVEIDGGDDAGDLARFAARTRIPPGLRRLYPSFARRTFVPVSPPVERVAGAARAAGFEGLRHWRTEGLPFVALAGVRG